MTMENVISDLRPEFEEKIWPRIANERIMDVDIKWNDKSKKYEQKNIFFGAELQRQVAERKTWALYAFSYGRMFNELSFQQVEEIFE